jgi:ABC-type transporter Mla subunit MlaD
MADNINNTGGGGNTGMAFIVGAIVVVLAVVAYFVFARGGAPETKKVDVNVDLPEVSAPAVPGNGG